MIGGQFGLKILGPPSERGNHTMIGEERCAGEKRMRPHEPASPGARGGQAGGVPDHAGACGATRSVAQGHGGQPARSPELIAADLAFHRIILETTRNPILRLASP